VSGWADVVGHQEALKMLVKKMINQVPQPGFYKMYHDVIHSHFHSGGLTLDLTCALHGPMDQVDPSKCPLLFPWLGLRWKLFSRILTKLMMKTETKWQPF
jgi:hypothetical protein